MKPRYLYIYICAACAATLGCAVDAIAPTGPIAPTWTTHYDPSTDPRCTIYPHRDAESDTGTLLSRFDDCTPIQFAPTEQRYDCDRVLTLINTGERGDIAFGTVTTSSCSWDYWAVRQ